MKQTNYIKQLNAAMEKFIKDDRLNPTHISLYLALFQYWNLNRFSNPFSISRGEIMKLSKIGSKSTYHKCIKQLHYWNYLEYVPSHNPFKGSKVIMFNFATSSKQALVYNSSNTGQALVHNSPNDEQALVSSKTYINKKQIKHKQQPKNLINVEVFFLENKSDKKEAQKFFNYYEANGWKVGGKAPMQNWKAAARNWILNTENSNRLSRSGSRETNSALVHNQDNLKTTKNKNYNEPL